MAEKNAKEMVKTAVAALQDKKGEDIRVIAVSYTHLTLPTT